MRVVVFNGSPKGRISVTMQYVAHLRRRLSGRADLVVFDIAKDITKIEKTPALLREIASHAATADAVLWAFPVYVFMVPAQVKRFIELISENGLAGRFAGKYATALTTSVRFYDVTAHDYIAAASEDLGMKWLDGYSAEMMELADEEGAAERMDRFADSLAEAVELKVPCQRRFEPMPKASCGYSRSGAKGIATNGITPESRAAAGTGVKAVSHGAADTTSHNDGNASKAAGGVTGRRARLLIMTDESGTGTSASNMVDELAAAFEGEVEIVDISRITMKGSGCSGCMNCSFESQCIFHDDVRKVFDEKVGPADAVVFAGAIRDRYLSSRWKAFMDRSFYRGHIPSYHQKPVGFMVAGAYGRLPWLRQIFSGMAGFNDSAFAGVVTDESGDDQAITAQIREMSRKLSAALASGEKGRPTFYSVAAHFIFREMVYRMWPLFRMDDIYYRANGLYDFPQKRIRERLSNAFFAFMLKIPPFRKYVYKNMRKLMLRPFEKFGKIEGVSEE